MRGKRRVLVGGGVRCGKSAFALALARRYGQTRAFVATAEAGDEEMRRRIDAHRAERHSSFATFEEPVDLAGALAKTSRFDVVVVDCLTLWLSNLLCRGADSAEVEAHIGAVMSALRGHRSHLIFVTNEVGMGLVPEHALGRAFRDWAGVLHQGLSREAGEIYFGALGSILRLKPAPLRLMPTAVVRATAGKDSKRKGRAVA